MHIPFKISYVSFRIVSFNYQQSTTEGLFRSNWPMDISVGGGRVLTALSDRGRPSLKVGSIISWFDPCVRVKKRTEHQTLLSSFFSALDWM